MNNIKITKNINEANFVTHAGTFHADEIFASVILSKIYDEMTIIRLPEVTEKLDDNIIVYDIGGGKFDHHQFGGNGERPNGVKYASCGLIWKEYGRKILQKYDIEDVEASFEYVEQNLIQFIDAHDNGQSPKAKVDYRNVHISYIIGLFNPKWDEKIDADEKFLQALNLAKIIFDEFMKDAVSKMKTKKIIDEAIENQNNGIMILEQNMPWKEFLINSKNEKAKKINYIIFPSKRGGYNVYAVPVERDSFENRKSLPKNWRGLRDEKLQDVTGVKSARFCHNAGFLITCEELDDAIKLATIANEATDDNEIN